MVHNHHAHEALHMMEKRDIKNDVLRHVDKKPEAKPDVKKDVLRHVDKKPESKPDIKKDVLRHMDKKPEKKPDIKKDVLRHVDKKPDSGTKQDNKMRFIHNLPDFAQKQQVDGTETVYSQVYVTATAPEPQNTGTASDAAASYERAKAAANAVKTSASSPAPVSKPAPVTVPTQRTRTKAAETETETSSTPVSSSIATSEAAPSKQEAAVHGGSPLQTSREPSVVGGTPMSATHSSDSQLIGQKTEGMTAGAKAGLAIGIIAAIGLAVGLVLFCLRRKKQQKKQEGAEKIDEKHASQDSFFGGMAAAATRGPNRDSMQSQKSNNSTRTAATAPRLSLRPVTQFLPNIIENRKSSGNALNAPAMSEKPKSGWDRNAAQNPFDDAAVVDEKARSTSPQSNPFDEGEPATPKSTKFGTAAAVPVNAGGASNSRGPNNVHRVQLDFKPSMEDELELRSGQIVRMLHEYDDGWALCIRLDRSQQGVCPRTCLSKLPVKPRPQGPPSNGAQGRPGPPPQNMRSRPASPQINGAMVPRPLTPTGRERSQTHGRNSPAPQENAGRPRSQSMGGSQPAGMPARKPVPGMAL